MDLLANTLRPKKIIDIIGQTHLVGKDKVITNMIKNKKVFFHDFVWSTWNW